MKHPNHPNLDLMLERLSKVKEDILRSPEEHLHLGCGPQILDGWTNIDKYHDDYRVTKLDMHELGLRYKPNSVATIYSSHALEHLPLHKARKALKTWYEVTQPEGWLYLAIPDLEEIMKIMLDPTVSNDIKWDWYIYTMYGYQVDTNIPRHQRTFDDPIDPGQIHYCNFTPWAIKRFLEEEGYKIQTLFKYDGWGTPSLWIEAQK